MIKRILKGLSDCKAMSRTWLEYLRYPMSDDYRLAFWSGMTRDCARVVLLSPGTVVTCVDLCGGVREFTGGILYTRDTN